MKIIAKLCFLYTIVTSLTELENKQRLFESLSRITFKGVWKSEDKLYHFDNKEGTIEILFQFIINYRRTKEYLYNYYLFLNDGDYKDKWIIIQNKIPQTLNQSTLVDSKDYITLTEEGVQASIFGMETLQPILRNYMPINLSLSIDADTKIYIPYYRNLTGTIELKGMDKKIEFRADIDNIFIKISNFAICFSVMGLVQLLNAKSMVERLEVNQMEAKRVNFFNLVITLCIFYKYYLECISGICLFLSFIV
jgi:hypothetical protein